MASGGNHLLAALAADDMRRLREHLELVPLARRATLYESGGRLQHVYFPTSGIVSLLNVMSDGSAAEVAVVGNEGCTGVCSMLTGAGGTLRATVRAAGYAYRIRATHLQAEFRRGGRLNHIILRYANALIAQLAQNAACSQRHSVGQRLCRWLLGSVDRMASNEVASTQEAIASMLGVRREGITEAASGLQKAGLIRYARGRIAVLSRSRLEARACECYKALRAETDRLVREVYAVKL